MNYRKNLLIVFLLLSAISVAQKKEKPKNTYNTKIEAANRVEINGGQTNIAKVDTVFIGQIIINQKPIDSILFIRAETSLDSNGIYTTNYIFAPKSPTPTFNVDIVIDFDKPYIPWHLFNPPPPRNGIKLSRNYDDVRKFYVSSHNGGSQTADLHRKDYLGLRVRGLVMADNIIISVKSKEKLFAKIMGVVGELEKTN